ncbi:MAG: hypothetical protein WCX97_05400 [Candidatus Magasanikbacteria bacterium]
MKKLAFILLLLLIVTAFHDVTSPPQAKDTDLRDYNEVVASELWDKGVPATTNPLSEIWMDGKNFPVEIDMSEALAGTLTQSDQDFILDT